MAPNRKQSDSTEVQQRKGIPPHSSSSAAYMRLGKVCFKFLRNQPCGTAKLLSKDTLKSTTMAKNKKKKKKQLTATTPKKKRASTPKKKRESISIWALQRKGGLPHSFSLRKYLRMEKAYRKTSRKQSSGT